MKLLLSKICSGLLGIMYIVWFFTPSILNKELVSITPFSSRNIIFFLIPLLGLVKITMVFLNNKLKIFKNNTSFLVSSIRFLETSIMLYAIFTPILDGAESIKNINNIPLVVLIFTIIILVLNILSVVILLRAINRKSSRYNSYLEFKKNNSGASLIFKIRTKLLVAFIGIITIIISVLSIQLLSNYKKNPIKSH